MDDGNFGDLAHPAGDKGVGGCAHVTHGCDTCDVCDGECFTYNKHAHKVVIECGAYGAVETDDGINAVHIIDEWGDGIGVVPENPVDRQHDGSVRAV